MDTKQFQRLSKLWKIECPIESLRQQMYEKVPKPEEAKRSVETEIAKEEIG